jgi:three-Cys-motif partner protein
MKKKNGFEWQIGSAPPPLQAHSAAKLKLIEYYLARYFETVVPDPRSDRLQISLVDGFCGGGAFLGSDGYIKPGSSLVMLKAIELSERHLNKRRIKKLKIDARYYFVDRSADAISYLKQEITKNGYGAQIGTSIHLINGKFEDHYTAIVSDVLAKARAGRSIFLLDQFGYKDVPMPVCRQIFEALPRSEIILTFAIDWLIDYISTNASFLKAVAPVELSEPDIKKYLETKGVRGHRYIVQRLVIKRLQIGTGAPYFTPFFIRSPEADRDLWLIHLSKHPTARNVMTSSHWAIQNASIHQGEAGLNMLGFDPHWQDTLPFDFEFDQNAAVKITEALQNDIPYKIELLDTYGPITFDAFQRAIANDTAARIDQIEGAVMRLHGEKVLDVLTPSGQLKRPDAKLVNTDRIQLTRQLMFPGMLIPKK